MTVSIFFREKVTVLGCEKQNIMVSSSSSPHRLSTFFKFHWGWQFGWRPQNLFCPSVLLFLEQLSKVAQGSSCKHTNLPLKSRPWGNSGTLLINSESHQPGSLPYPLWRYETCTSRHTSASRLGCTDILTSHFIGKWRQNRRDLAT